MICVTWMVLAFGFICIHFISPLPMQQTDQDYGGHSRRKRSVNIYIYPGQSSKVTLIFNNPSADLMKLASLKTHHVQNVEGLNHTLKVGDLKELSNRTASNQQKAKTQEANVFYTTRYKQENIPNIQDNIILGNILTSNLSKIEEPISNHRSFEVTSSQSDINSDNHKISQQNMQSKLLRSSLARNSSTIGNYKTDQSITKDFIAESTRLRNLTSPSQTQREYLNVSTTKPSSDISFSSKQIEKLLTEQESADNYQKNVLRTNVSELNGNTVPKSSSVLKTDSPGRTFFEQAFEVSSINSHSSNQSSTQNELRHISAKGNSSKFGDDVSNQTLASINYVNGEKRGAQTLQSDHSTQSNLSTTSLALEGNYSVPKTGSVVDEPVSNKTSMKPPSITLSSNNHSSSLYTDHTSLDSLSSKNVSQVNKTTSNQSYDAHALLEQTSGFRFKNNSQLQENKTLLGNEISNTSLPRIETSPNQTTFKYQESEIEHDIKDQTLSKSIEHRSLDSLDSWVQYQANKRSLNKSSSERPSEKSITASSKVIYSQPFEKVSLIQSPEKNVSNSLSSVESHQNSTKKDITNFSNTNSQIHNMTTVQNASLKTPVLENETISERNTSGKLDASFIGPSTTSDPSTNSQILEKNGFGENHNSNLPLIREENSKYPTFKNKASSNKTKSSSVQNKFVEIDALEVPTSSGSDEHVSNNSFHRQTSVDSVSVDDTNSSKTSEKRSSTTNQILNAHLTGKERVQDHSTKQKPFTVVEHNKSLSQSYGDTNQGASTTQIVSNSDIASHNQSVPDRFLMRNVLVSLGDNISELDSKNNGGNVSNHDFSDDNILFNQTEKRALTHSAGIQNPYEKSGGISNTNTSSSSKEGEEDFSNQYLLEISQGENNTKQNRNEDNHHLVFRKDRFHGHSDALDQFTGDNYLHDTSTKHPVVIYSKQNATQKHVLTSKQETSSTTAADDATSYDNKSSKYLILSRQNITSKKRYGERENHYQIGETKRVPEGTVNRIPLAVDDRTSKIAFGETPSSIGTNEHSQGSKHMKSSEHSKSEAYATFERDRRDHQRSLKQEGIQANMTPRNIDSDLTVDILSGLRHRTSNESNVHRLHNHSITSDISRDNFNKESLKQSYHRKNENHNVEDNFPIEKPKKSNNENHNEKDDFSHSKTKPAALSTGNVDELPVFDASSSETTFMQNEPSVDKYDDHSETEDHQEPEHNESDETDHHEKVLEKIAVLKHLLTDVHSQDEHHTLEDILSQIINSVPPAPKSTQNNQRFDDQSSKWDHRSTANTGMTRSEKRTSSHRTLSHETNQSEKLSHTFQNHPLQHDFGTSRRKAKPIKHSLQHMMARIKDQGHEYQRRVDSEELWK